jgi:hypothetical protein
MWFRLVLKNIAADKYAHDFSAYERDVELIFQNAIHYNAEDGTVADLARELWADFKALVAELKTRKIQSATKSFSNAQTRPNSSVAAILEQKNRAKFISSLVPSAANLVVVPETLLSHWVVSRQLCQIILLPNHVFQLFTKGPVHDACRPALLYHQGTSCVLFQVERWRDKRKVEETHTELLGLENTIPMDLRRQLWNITAARARFTGNVYSGFDYNQAIHP